MAIRGTFFAGRPSLRGRLFIPQLNKSHYIVFVVDTGSNATTLTPHDGMTMGLDYGGLAYDKECLAFGSQHHCAVLPAKMIFRDEDGALPVFDIDLNVAPRSHSILLPSVLGLDVLRRLRITWDYSQDQLDCEVLSCDGDWNAHAGIQKPLTPWRRPRRTKGP